jgi:hypothetical protein
MRKLTCLAVLLLLLSASFPLQAEEDKIADRVAILYTGETHGNVEPCG